MNAIHGPGGMLYGILSWFGSIYPLMRELFGEKYCLYAYLNKLITSLILESSKINLYTIKSNCYPLYKEDTI